MYVQIDRRDDYDSSTSQSLLLIRRKLMKGYGKQENKWVLSIHRRPSFLLGFLEVICQYAAVDKITLLPILIIFNAFVMLVTLEEFALLL
jgi:hypothetical protein